MTFQHIYRGLALLIAANCAFSTNEVGSLDEGLTKGPLAAAPRPVAQTPMADLAGFEPRCHHGPTALAPDVLAHSVAPGAVGPDETVERLAFNAAD